MILVNNLLILRISNGKIYAKEKKKKKSSSCAHLFYIFIFLVIIVIVIVIIILCPSLLHLHRHHHKFDLQCHDEVVCHVWQWQQFINSSCSHCLHLVFFILSGKTPRRLNECCMRHAPIMVSFTLFTWQSIPMSPEVFVVIIIKIQFVAPFQSFLLAPQSGALISTAEQCS